MSRDIDPSIQPHIQECPHESLFIYFCQFIVTVGFPTDSRQRLFQVFGHDDSKDPSLSHLRRDS